MYVSQLPIPALPNFHFPYLIIFFFHLADIFALLFRTGVFAISSNATNAERRQRLLLQYQAGSIFV
jgi:hypothetical protein